MAQVQEECERCGGTGLYQRFVDAVEESGTFTVCSACEGRGWQTRCRREFTGRRRPGGVRAVRTCTSLPVLTYDEFVQAYPEEGPRLWD